MLKDTKVWTERGIELGTGILVGGIDQWIQNKDDARAQSRRTQMPPGTLSMQSQYGTYLNFGLPLADVVLVALEVLKGDWASRLTTVAGQLVGRKMVHKLSNEKHLNGYPGSDNTVNPVSASAAGYRGSEYNRARELDARRKAAEEAARRAAAEGARPQSGVEIPVVTGGQILA